MQTELLPNRKLSQKDRILRLLQTKGQVSNTELNKHVGFRYGARLHELRNEGYDITTSPTMRHGLVYFTYRGRI